MGAKRRARVRRSAIAAGLGFPGVFDMSGNVTEFEDSCPTTTADAINVARSYASSHKGIRCCAP